MENYDWSKFCKRISVKAGVQDIYDALATQVMLEKWFLRTAEFTKPDGTIRSRYEHIEAGDHYRWLWHGWDDDTMEQGEIIAANGRDEVQFTFVGKSTVSINIKMDVDDELVVELWQRDIPTDGQSKVNIHLACMKGWTFYLSNLKAFLEEGPDLRNKNARLKNMVNA